MKRLIENELCEYDADILSQKEKYFAKITSKGIKIVDKIQKFVDSRSIKPS